MEADVVSNRCCHSHHAGDVGCVDIGMDVVLDQRYRSRRVGAVPLVVVASTWDWMSY